MHIREARGYYYTVILQLRICGDDVFGEGSKLELAFRYVIF